jgi:hypothetical protein
MLSSVISSAYSLSVIENGTDSFMPLSIAGRSLWSGYRYCVLDVPYRICHVRVILPTGDAPRISPT